MTKSSDAFRNAPPGISIPYYYQGQIWKIRILLTKNGQPPERGQEEYYTIPGGSECLYQAGDVRPSFPVVLVDEEFDAALIKQCRQLLCRFRQHRAHRKMDPTWSQSL